MPACSVEFPPAHRSNIWEFCQPETQFSTDYRFNEVLRSEEQFYEGEFFRDSFHGQGAYKWNNVGVYEGCFFSNFKDGYACVSLPNNSNFEGLFVKNRPFGPGIYTHPNGRQDAGFWVGPKLVRLSRAVDFIIPRLAPSSAAKIKLLPFRHRIPLDEENWENSMTRYTDILKKCGYPFEHFYSPYSSLIYDPRSTFFELIAFEKIFFKNSKNYFQEFTGSSKDWEVSLRQSVEHVDDEESEEGSKDNSVPSHCLCSTDAFEMKYKDEEKSDVCDAKSVEGERVMGILAHFTKFGTEFEVSSESPCLEEEGEAGYEIRASNILSWNRSELCTEILKQIFRYREFEDNLNFHLSKLMVGARTAFRRTGAKEKECLQFLKMCSIGPAKVIKDLLCAFDISPELMDARGNNSLMFAAAADLHDVIDLLLDYGVDVNSFNDEHLTALNLCLLRRLAQAFGLSSWETVFLPNETEAVQVDYLQLWQTQESITSLDRIFGDGMSLEDSRSLAHSFPSVFQPQFGHKENSQTYSRSECSANVTESSQITAFNIRKHAQISYLNFNYPRYNSTAAKKSFSNPELPDAQNHEVNEGFFSAHQKIVPASIRRSEFQESISQKNTDRYFFEFVFGQNPSGRGAVETETSESKTVKQKPLKTEEMPETEEVNGEDDQLPFNAGRKEKIAEIDKTILKLLKRGADPNISEVPKPSIHLGIYTKDLSLMMTLLMFGANPNSQLSWNDGSLTPLHVIVLLPSAQVNVEICKLLLDHNADTALETSSEFFLSESEKIHLDPETGRIPLELLCMRPDLDVADPNEHLIKIGLMLVERTKQRFYNGFSWLTLAMLSGNLKFLKALLESKLFDPNEILEKERGTTLHVLVSTELQLKTNFPTSIKMCDLLLDQGANPLMTFNKPARLLGNCVDYGYREIDEAKQARQGTASTDKKDKKKPEKTVKDKTVDYLEDHRKVVEYLDRRASEMGGGKKKKDEGIGEKKSKDSKKNLKERSSKDTKKDKDDGSNGKKDDDSKSKRDKDDDSKRKKDKDDDSKRKKGKGDSKKNKGKSKIKDKKSTQKKSKDDKDKKGSKDSEKDSKKEKDSSQESTCGQNFPAALLRNLLGLYGNCVNIDINELLVPYVILRGSELYYRFKGGKASFKEQYSLI